MAASSKLMIKAERRFPVRVKVAIQEGGLAQLTEIHSWLDSALRRRRVGHRPGRAARHRQ